MLCFDGMDDWHESMEDMFKNMINVNNRAEASEDEDQEVGDDFVVLENEEEAAGEDGEDNAGEGNVGDEVGELENCNYDTRTRAIWVARSTRVTRVTRTTRVTRAMKR